MNGEVIDIVGISEVACVSRSERIFGGRRERICVLTSERVFIGGETSFDVERHSFAQTQTRTPKDANGPMKHLPPEQRPIMTHVDSSSTVRGVG